MSRKKSVTREKYSALTQAFGKRFRLLRRELGLNQELIAREFSVGKGTVSEWENGKYLPSLSFVLEFARKYNVNMLWLLEGGKQPKYLPEQVEYEDLRVRDERSKEYGKTEEKILSEVMHYLRQDKELLQTVWHLVKAQQGLARIKKQE